MANFTSMNEWSFSGEVYYLKELEKDYGASIKIRGTAPRGDSVASSQIAELSCLLTKDAYEQAKKRGLSLYKKVAVSGHIETFVKDADFNKVKNMFIAEYVLEVA